MKEKGLVPQHHYQMFVSKISAYSGRSEFNFSRQNGLKFGRFESIAVRRKKGIVSALFDTGQSILFINPMGIVPNADGLEFKTETFIQKPDGLDLWF